MPLEYNEDSYSHDAHTAMSFENAYQRYVSMIGEEEFSGDEKVELLGEMERSATTDGELRKLLGLCVPHSELEKKITKRIEALSIEDPKRKAA
jgi:hypothetical protein